MRVHFCHIYFAGNFNYQHLIATAINRIGFIYKRRQSLEKDSYEN